MKKLLPLLAVILLSCQKIDIQKSADLNGYWQLDSTFYPAPVGWVVDSTYVYIKPKGE